MKTKITDNEFSLTADYSAHSGTNLEPPVPPEEDPDHDQARVTKVSGSGRFLRPRNWARVIVFFYFLFLPAMAYLAYLFFGNTVADFAAPADTLVARATLVAETYLPDQVFRDPAFLLISRKDGGALTLPNESSSASSWNTVDICMLLNFVRETGATEFNSSDPLFGGFIAADGYCKYIEYPAIAAEFYSKDKKLTLIMVNMIKTSAKRSAWPQFQSKIENYLNTNSSLANLQMSVTSEGSILDETEESVLGDLVLIDSIAIPIAFFTLALCLRSFRMLLVAASQIGVTVPYMFGILYGVSTRIGISSFAPECSSAVVVALSIDYSLFIGSRFNERIKIAILDGTDVYDEDIQLSIVFETTKLCAHNIIVSGLAIGIALAGLILVPLELISTIGIAFFVGTLVSVIVAMTLQPAILLAGFEFFARDPGFNLIFKNVPCLAKMFADDMDEDFLPAGALLEEQQERVERGLEVEEDKDANELRDIQHGSGEDAMNNNTNNNIRNTNTNNSNNVGRPGSVAPTASTDGPPSLILTPATSARSHPNNNNNNNNNNMQEREEPQPKVLFFAVNDDDEKNNSISSKSKTKNNKNNNNKQELEEGLLQTTNSDSNGNHKNDDEDEKTNHGSITTHPDSTKSEEHHDPNNNSNNAADSLATSRNDGAFRSGSLERSDTYTNNSTLQTTPRHGGLLSPRITATSGNSHHNNNNRHLLSPRHHSSSNKNNHNNNDPHHLRSPRSPALTSLSVASYEAHLSPTEARRHQIARRSQNNSTWFKVGQFAVRNSCFVVVVLVLLLIPFIVAVSYLDVSFDLFSQVPRGSEKVKTLDRVLSDIGTGALSAPFFVTIDTGKPNGLGYAPQDVNLSALVEEGRGIDGINQFFPSSSSGNVSNPHGFNETVFQVLQQFVVYVSGRTGIKLDRISSYVAFSGAGLGFLSFEADALAACARVNVSMIPPNYITPAAKQLLQGCREYNQLVNRTVDPTYQVALLILAPDFDTFGSEANPFLNNLNRAISEFDTQGMFTVGFFGASAVDWQILQSILGLMPLQIGLTFGVIFIIVAVVFRSAVIPFRMLFTMLYTLIVSFGASVFLFQTPGVREVWGPNSPHAFVWLIPLFAFSLLCALALDYDVFILSRIVEYKKLGFSNEAACCKAIWKSGRVVTFACMIMFISFSSLLLSRTQMLQQFGFIAGLAVLVDGFVIRSFLVPALLNFQLPKNCCWYPLRFEDETRPTEDMTESTAE